MGLNKLGTVITGITAVTLVALAVEIVYVLWQRRQRLRPRVRVEPREASLHRTSSSSSSSNSDDMDLELEQHVLKWQCLSNGPSRVLFTIKEETEREEVESDNCNGNRNDCSFELEKVAVDAVDLNETTPFSTPCGSPPYFTPQASPIREEYCKGHNCGNG
ncbi:hypothetical protein Fmac_027400 [Flemingia macrophylla]|uniref:Uncharacterized protein n=1 Tax=Flemingia macrophylla TaxID=520843 RepID=A0ABD1LHN0_9FABA